MVPGGKLNYIMGIRRFVVPATRTWNRNIMPDDLRRAHRENDRAVLKAYGFAPDLPEPEIVAELMKRYQALAEGGKEGAEQK